MCVWGGGGFKILFQVLMFKGSLSTIVNTHNTCLAIVSLTMVVADTWMRTMDLSARLTK